MSTWTQIASLDAPSGGVFDFPSITFTGYILVEVIISGVTVTTDGTSITLQFYSGGGLITSAGYRWDVLAETSAAETHDGATASTSIGLTSNNASETVGNATGEAFNAILLIDVPLSSALTKRYESEIAFTDQAGSVNVGNGVGAMDGTGALEGFKLSGSSNLTAGRVRVLGLA